MRTLREMAVGNRGGVRRGGFRSGSVRTREKAGVEPRP